MNASSLRCLLALLPICAAAISVVEAQVAAPAGDARRGEQLYLSVGCYECHGTRGAGALNNAPRIAPDPVPWAAFMNELRHPAGAPPFGNMKMPRYGPAVLSDAQITDIYAYLASIRPGPPAAVIPLLNR